MGCCDSKAKKRKQQAVIKEELYFLLATAKSVYEMTKLFREHPEIATSTFTDRNLTYFQYLIMVQNYDFLEAVYEDK